MENVQRSFAPAAIALTAVLALTLSACGGPPRLTNDGTRPSTPSANIGTRAGVNRSAQASPGLDAIASAAAGSVHSVDEPGLGGPVELTVLRAYNAASGRLCKQVSVRRVTDGGMSGRVACQGDTRWYWSPVTTG
jgi:hypothetical protein